MRRRDFITFFGSAAVWPFAARAQPPAMPVIGWLSIVTPEASPALPFFRRGLADLGYVEDRNLVILYRWAEFHPERFPALAADLVQSHVSLIAAVSGVPAVLAAKAASATIPIVFVVPTDPVQLGLVASLNRPGGNLTGVAALNAPVLMKQIELMHELLASNGPLAVLFEPIVEAADLEQCASCSENARSARNCDSRRKRRRIRTGHGDGETSAGRRLGCDGSTTFRFPSSAVCSGRRGWDRETKRPGRLKIDRV